MLGRGADPYRVAAIGALVGVPAFTSVIFAAPLSSVPLFALGVALIGFGGGLFALAHADGRHEHGRESQSGLALGTWGAVQATAAGSAIATGGVIRDRRGGPRRNGRLGPALTLPATGYGAVYAIEIGLLFAALVTIGPLVRSASDGSSRSTDFGLAEISRLAKFCAEIAHANRRHHRLYRRSPARPLRLLALLRRADLLPAARGPARGLSARARSQRALQGRARLRADTFMPKPKLFYRPHDGTVAAPEPRRADVRELRAERVAAWPGAPLRPVGEPMLAGVGAGGWAEREDVPERTLEGEPLIVPLRVAEGFFVEPRDPDPRGMQVIGADGGVAGAIVDLWVDRAEPQVRYLEVELPGAASAVEAADRAGGPDRCSSRGRGGGRGNG